MTKSLALILLLVLAGCGTTDLGPEHLFLTAVSYDELTGWKADAVSEALPALARSCRQLLKKAPNETLGLMGSVADWEPACQGLGRLPPGDNEAARVFFETEFIPYAAAGNEGTEGLFTGYYEAELHGTWKRHGRYQTPLYARPRDLVLVDLGTFRPEWRGNRVTGRVVGNRLQPYDNRGEIAKGSLKKRAKVLLWVDSPLDAFFLEIQGSGRVRMTDGSLVRVGYDGSNGRPYLAIGRVMLETGMIEKPVTMQAIRAWIEAHPAFAQQTLNINPSYVFFRIIKGDGPIGAQGLPLSPGRSLAVDSSFVPLGIPLWIDVREKDNEDAAFLQRLVIAQDTGGAIKGPVRGDYFWGFGTEAANQAGVMQNQGRYYLLLPKTVALHAP